MNERIQPIRTTIEAAGELGNLTRERMGKAGGSVEALAALLAKVEAPGRGAKPAAAPWTSSSIRSRPEMTERWYQ